MYNIYIIYCSSLQIQAARLSALAQIFCRTACAAAQSLSRIIEVNVSNFPCFLFPRIGFFEGLNSAKSFFSGISCISEAVPYFAQVKRVLQGIIWVWPDCKAGGTGHICSSNIFLVLSWAMKDRQMLSFCQVTEVFSALQGTLCNGNCIPYRINHPVL